MQSLRHLIKFLAVFEKYDKQMRSPLRCYQSLWWGESEQHKKKHLRVMSPYRDLIIVFSISLPCFIWAIFEVTLSHMWETVKKHYWSNMRSLWATYEKHLSSTAAIWEVTLSHIWETLEHYRINMRGCFEPHLRIMRNN